LRGCKRIDFTIPQVSGIIIQVGPRRYKITAHKPREAENLIRQLSYDTPLTRLITKASHDPLTRALCFLSYERIAGKRGVISLPVITDTLQKDLLETKMADLKDSAEATSRELNMMANIVWSGLAKAITDVASEYVKNVRKLRHKRGEVERERLLKEFMERFENRIAEEIAKYKNEIESFNEFMEIKRLTPIEAIRRVGLYTTLSDIFNDFERVKSIYDHIKEAAGVDQITIPDLQDLLSNLSDLEVFYGIMITSICLKKSCFFNLTTYNLVNFYETCISCKENAMLNIFHACVHKDIENAWELGLLPEMIIAYMFHGKKWVRNVYLHKALQQLINGPTKSVELDVIIHTENDKIIIIETTSHHRMEDIFKEIDRKVQIIQRSKVDIDVLFYVTSAPFQEYFPYREDPFPTWILGRRHLKKLDEHVEYILRKRLHML